VVVVPKDQVWYYSKEWQDKEREVELQVAEGKIHQANSKEELFKGLGLNDED
jgi:antitoxin MazE